MDHSCGVRSGFRDGPHIMEIHPIMTPRSQHNGMYSASTFIASWSFLTMVNGADPA